MSFSLLQPLHEIPFAFVDTETTGVSPDYGHRVIEVGIVRIEGGQVVAEYQQLIDPRRKISPGVVELTGITNDMVAGQPTFNEQLPRATELLSGAIIVGHNVRFDLSFLHHEYRCCGQQMGDCFPKAMVLDTLQFARRRFGRGGNGLQRLARRLGVLPTTAHRALADAQTTFQVFEKMLFMLSNERGWQTPLADTLLAHGNPITLKVSRESLLPLALEEALEQRKAVVMEYLDANAQRTRRIIQPLQVKRFRGDLVLLAHCQLRGSQRTFKVERIVQLTRMEEQSSEITLFDSAPLPSDLLPQAPISESVPLVASSDSLPPATSSGTITEISQIPSTDVLLLTDPVVSLLPLPVLRGRVKVGAGEDAVDETTKVEASAKIENQPLPYPSPGHTGGGENAKAVPEPPSQELPGVEALLDKREVERRVGLGPPPPAPNESPLDSSQRLT